MYHCIIVDDEQTARNILKRYINDIPFLQLEGAFKNAIDALAFINTQAIDLVFLDIEMPKLSGINLAKILENKTKVIFTTAHREFAIDGFELNAVDYLLKPISFERFLKAADRVTQSKKPEENTLANDYIYVKVNKQMIKISFAGLLYIEGLNNYVKLHTEDETYVVYEKMSTLIKTLPSGYFRRIHKSYIINTQKIKLYTREYVELANRQLPIGPTYRTELLDFLKE